MSQSLVKNAIHLIYTTKQRQRWIHEESRDALYAYQAGILRNCESPAVIIGGVDDHVHTLFCLSRNRALKDVVENVKKQSSKWYKARSANRYFRWQAGYAAFSVSESLIRRVREYIANQEYHHSSVSVQDELRALFRRHNVEFDERYVWD